MNHDTTKTIRPSRTAVAVCASALLLALTACTPNADGAPPVEDERRATHPVEASTEESAGETAADHGIDPAAFAERDAFMAAQGFGDHVPDATTAPQNAYIDAVRATFESSGTNWDPEYAGLYLALTSDACETSILNGHQIDTDLVLLYLATEPVIQQMIPTEATPEQRVPFERHYLQAAVAGVSQLCPADYEQWDAAYQAIFAG